MGRALEKTLGFELELGSELGHSGPAKVSAIGWWALRLFRRRNGIERGRRLRATLPVVNPRDIREFVARQREPVQQLKREYWASATEEGAPLSALEAGHALHAHARAVQPGFPDAQYSTDDFNHHVQLKLLLDRAAQAFTIRRASR
jgi:hypothetical protein